MRSFLTPISEPPKPQRNPHRQCKLFARPPFSLEFSPTPLALDIYMQFTLVHSLQHPGPQHNFHSIKHTQNQTEVPYLRYPGAQNLTANHIEKRRRNRKKGKMGSIPPPPLNNLTSHLPRSLVSSHPQLTTSILPSLLGAISCISASLRTAQTVAPTSTTNTFGDAQLNVDMLAESHLRAALVSCPAVHAASSEEDPVERTLHLHQPGVDRLHGVEGEEKEEGEEYTVAFDPLDGSSIIAPNWTVGTIIGIWRGKSALGKSPRSEQVAAVLGVFGPRTTAVIAVRFPEEDKRVCVELGEVDGGVWEVLRERVEFEGVEKGKGKERYFAPANLRAAAEDEKYMALVEKFIRERYTLRYCGGLVPDVYHGLVKGKGVYLSPVTAGSKAKLRRLYELCPVALVVECAGGKAIDPADGGKEVLDKEVKSCDERGGLICGTREEVEMAGEALLG